MRSLIRLLALGVCWVLLSACASSGGLLGSSRAGTEPTARERIMLSEQKGGRAGRVSALEAALIVGGPRDPDDLADAVR
jgi:hypothetical protein